MLVILATVPVSAPDEAVLGEQLVAQVIFINLVGKRFAPVGIGFTAGGRYLFLAVIIGDVRIKERIDVNGKSLCMFGKLCGAFHCAVIETGGVVVLHGQQIIRIVFIYQADTLDLVFCLIELIKDFDQIPGNRLIADEFPGARAAVKVRV